MGNSFDSLKNKIKNKTAKIAVIGQGYVGLPLSVLIAKSGFFVWGIDKNRDKIKYLLNKKSYIDDVKNAEIEYVLNSKKFKPTSSFNILKQTDIVIIAVPTPIDKHKTPDLSYIKSASKEISKRIHKGMLIILESTTYPGTTEEVVLPLLINNKSKSKNFNKTKLRAGKDFFLSFSPERIDPGNKKYNITNTPKVVGGVTLRCAKISSYFYSQIIKEVVPVSSAKIAEMSKLLENIFRTINISFINEMALLCDKMKIDIWEVIEAAKTKPYGFMPFYPSPKIGGHCLAVDPFYLSYKARELGFFTRFIDLSAEINELMPHYVVTKVATALNYSQRKSINGSKILIIGASYKKDIGDIRESAAIPIIKTLYKKGAKLKLFDPLLDKIGTKSNNKINALKIKKLDKKVLQSQDLVLILTDHSDIDYDKIALWSKTIVDTRNAIKSRKYKNVFRI